ncbi:MAG: gamma-glutamylcyclotransferase family protein [Pseudomonadota bacterium]
MKVFFYGLFMDEHLLAAKGIKPSEVNSGFVDGYALRIGERATLVRRPDNRAYGVMMDIASHEATTLYTDESVADYLPETVTVELMDGARVEATCYNLPGDKVTGTNKDYAQALLAVATGLNFPESYLDQIRQARSVSS